MVKIKGYVWYEACLHYWHKSPDMDSLASSIAYKVFKQTTDEGMYYACAASEPTQELQDICITWNGK